MTGSTYQILYQLARDLHSHNFDTRRIVQTALDRAASLVNAAQGCVVTFYDESKIDDAHVIGTQAETTVWEMLLARGVIGYVYYAQRVVTIHDLSADARWPNLDGVPQTGSAVGLPLPRGAGVGGIMLFIHPQVAYFDDAKLALLDEVASLTTEALNNALDFRNVESAHVRYQAIFNNAVMPMLLTDLDGKIINVNAQAIDLLGSRPTALIGQPVTTIHDLDMRTLLDGESLNALRLHEERTIRTTLMTGHDDPISALVRLRRLRLDGQDVVEWVEQDISAQMELEQLRRDLTAMVYHDLRGPLQTVRGSINKLGQVLANHENPAVLTLLQVGIRSVRQLQRMVDSLLDVQRLEEGRAVLSMRPVELRVLLADAVQLVQPLAIDAAIKLGFDLQDDLPEVEMDSDMMIRVVINLLENAIKYTPQGGQITLGAYRDGSDRVMIRVRDSGPGIPPEMSETIFDKFNRVKYDNAPKGIGLGLAFCRLAVDAHGGCIWVESELGRGSDFIFTLPMGAGSPESGESTTALQTTA